jgi:hypothetical protein
MKESVIFIYPIHIIPICLPNKQYFEFGEKLKWEIHAQQASANP